jgi:hypothetical protein
MEASEYGVDVPAACIPPTFAFCFPTSQSNAVGSAKTGAIFLILFFLFFFQKNVDPSFFLFRALPKQQVHGTTDGSNRN